MSAKRAAELISIGKANGAGKYRTADGRFVEREARDATLKGAGR
jgi:hypothetical protein